MSYAKKSVVEALKSAGIGVSRACKFMESEVGGRENVGFIRKDAYDHINRFRRVSNIDFGDAYDLLEFLNKRGNEEPLFWWKVQADDEGCLMNFFYRDVRSAIDYQFFGDAISVDTTFKTNKYNLFCAPIVGVNHHRHNVMFGMAFLSDETTQSFEWLFSTFIESIGGKEPQVIFSDQALAIINGIDYSFKTASHRLCQWHINRNAPRHFGPLNGDRAFKKMWHHYMNDCETEDEFESSWKDMVDMYDLGDYSWFNTMYNLKRKWASALTNKLFSAGMHATSRSETTNKVLKDAIAATSTLREFVSKYEEMQVDWRSRENAEDALCVGMPGQIVQKNVLLTQAAKVLTRNVFKLFEEEALNSINVSIIEESNSQNGDNVEFKVLAYNIHRKLIFCRSTQFCRCSCHMWETDGVICVHIWRTVLILPKGNV